MTNKVTKAELLEFANQKDKVREYTNGEVTVYWRADLCIHSANCLIGLPGVFNSGKKPWINMQGANSKEIMATVNTCPSRALVFKRNASPVSSKQKRKGGKTAKFARVQILRNGPALITGNFIIRDPDKKKIKIKTETAALCRCGGTRKSPFCDGTHLAIGFKG